MTGLLRGHRPRTRTVGRPLVRQALAQVTATIRQSGAPTAPSTRQPTQPTLQTTKQPDAASSTRSQSHAMSPFKPLPLSLPRLTSRLPPRSQNTVFQGNSWTVLPQVRLSSSIPSITSLQSSMQLSAPSSIPSTTVSHMSTVSVPTSLPSHTFYPLSHIPVLIRPFSSTPTVSRPTVSEPTTSGSTLSRPSLLRSFVPRSSSSLHTTPTPPPPPLTTTSTSSSSTSTSTQPDSLPDVATPYLPTASTLSRGLVSLQSRRLLAITGPDAAKYLQGAITNSVYEGPKDGPVRRDAFYAGFLNAQGRLLFDVIVYPMSLLQGQSFGGQSSDDCVEVQGPEGTGQRLTSEGTGQLTEGSQAEKPWLEGAGFLVEVDAEQIDRLAKYIRRFKLRADFATRILSPSELQIWHLWGEADMESKEIIDTLPFPWTTSGHGHGVVVRDPRTPALGYRILSSVPLRTGEGGSSREEAPLGVRAGDLLLVQGSAPSDELAYRLHRYAHGVAEGQRELPSGEALPQESNLDALHGIDFHKGCYIGQELTIRTKHTGVVRKRILPCVLAPHRETPPIPAPTHTLSAEQGVSQSPSAPSPESPATPPASSPISPEPSKAQSSESPSSDLVARSQSLDAPHTNSLDAQVIPSGSSITRVGQVRGRPSGKWLCGVGSIGLAVCRLDTMAVGTVGADVDREDNTTPPKPEFVVQWTRRHRASGDTQNAVQEARDGEMARHKVVALVPAWLRARLGQDS